jgi:oligosaccharide amylase
MAFWQKMCNSPLLGKVMIVTQTLQKPYLVNSIIGNGRILAALLQDGELVRAFWPTIDYAQHVNKTLAGIRINGSDLIWLNDPRFDHTQQYIPDTNVVQTNSVSKDLSVAIELLDYVTPDTDVIVRHYRFVNLDSEAMELDFLYVSDFHMEESPLYQTVLYDETSDSVAHYRRSYWTMVGGQERPYGFQIGNVQNHLNERRFHGGSVTMGSDAAQVWTETIKAGGQAEFSIYIAFGHNRTETRERLEHVRSHGHARLLESTKRHAADFLAKGKQIATGNEQMDALYRRSLLVFSLMADDVYGGLIAAPEFDPFFTRCGGYGYCWGRDAAYITTAIDKAGYTEMGKKFYRWAMRVQDADGSWDHRHYMNGDLAPAWGYQADEPASILWGMWQHYLISKDEDFLQECWPSMEKGADRLLETIDPDTNFPLPSMDLWEERFGQHTYSSAAVAAALLAVADAARHLGYQQQAEQYQQVAQEIKTAVAKLYNSEKNSWYRGISLHVEKNQAAQLTSAGESVNMYLDRYGYERYAVVKDSVVDASLLGLSYPFQLFDARHPAVTGTSEAVKALCSQPGVGGIRRYENDPYIGGNPWILTTLWYALDANRRGETDKVQESLEWVLRNQTETGLLPEQVDKNTGGPAWVVPLTWSHAMYVLLILEHFAKE